MAEAPATVPAAEATMPPSGRRFRYRAVLVATGREQAGEQVAESGYALRQALARVGLRATAIEAVTPEAAREWLTPLRQLWQGHLRRRRRQAKTDLAESLVTLLQAGMPLEQALGALMGSLARPPGERSLAARLRERVRDGAAFSDACAQEPAWFDRFDCALLDAGQQAGELTAALGSLAQHHRRLGNLGQKIVAALAYPALLLLASLAALEVMSLTVLPQLTEMLSQARRQPPWLTLAVIEAGRWFILWFPLTVVIGLGATWYLRRIAGRIDPTGRAGRWILGNPIARWRRRSRAARLAWMLSRLRRTGMPMTTALTIIAGSLDDRALRHLVHDAVAGLNRGEDFSAMLTASRLVDQEFASLVHLGEHSGELTETLERIAERYQQAADRSADQVSALLGPVAILILAGFISLLVLAAALPLARLGDLV